MQIFFRIHEILEKRVVFITFGLASITVGHAYNASCRFHGTPPLFDTKYSAGKNYRINLFLKFFNENE